METVAKIPKIFLYEEFDGHPIYRKGYRDFMLGLKKIEEINMGTSSLQFFIINVILKFLHQNLPANYFAGGGELGLHLAKNTNLALDIAIFRQGKLNVGLDSVNYADVPPAVVIEVDIKAEDSDFFQSEQEYFQKKTEKLLRFGVEKVIWITTSTQRILIADNLDRWEIIGWNNVFEIIDGYEINVWDLMLKSGIQV